MLSSFFEVRFDGNFFTVIHVVHFFAINKNLGKIHVYRIQINGIYILDYFKLIGNSAVNTVFNGFGFNPNLGM